MNTNWAKILLFTLLGFALGFIICCMTCGRCMGGGCEGDSCRSSSACHAEASCGRGGGHGKKACCKGDKGMHMESDSMGTQHGHHHAGDSTHAH
ncbi:MAG: hypothetical protein IPM46_11870 [Flavobacteriales bacterium]|nr:hypothetical protein [Flavobacteriales bacterium]